MGAAQGGECSMNTAARRNFAPSPAVCLPTGALACSGYRAPRHLPNGSLQTCTGIVIGGAIAPVMPTATQDGERIQAALLDPRTAVAKRGLVRRALRAFWAWC